MANIIEEKSLLSIKSCDNLKSNEDLNEKRYSYHCNWKSCGFNTTDYMLLSQHLEETHININEEKVFSQEFDDNIDKPKIHVIDSKSNVDYNQENHSIDGKMNEWLKCTQIGCHFTTETSVELSSHMNIHRVIDESNDNFGVETNEESDEENDDKSDSVKDNSSKCTYPDCEYLGQNLVELRIHLLNKHKIDGKVYVDINKSLKETIETHKDSKVDEMVHKTNTKSSKCYVKDCEYKGHKFHGLRIHLLRKHGIHVNVERPKETMNQLIILTSKSCKCTIPKCGYVGKNTHSLRIHYNRRHEMRVTIKTQFTNKPIDKPINKTIDKTIDKIIDKTIDKTIDKSIDKSIDESIDESIDDNIELEETSKDKTFRCIHEDCDYESPKFNSLRSHVIRKHKVYPVKDDENSGIKVKDRPEMVRNTQVFECKQKDCQYVGETALGLRVHMRQKHMIRVRTSLINATNTITLNTNAADVQQNKSFECPIFHCPYVGKSLVGLRFHKRNKHNIRSNFQPIQSTIALKSGVNRAEEAINRLRVGLKRKYVRNLNVNNDNRMSYRLKRSCTWRSNTTNQDINKGLVSAKPHIHQDKNRVNVPINRKYRPRLLVNYKAKNEDTDRGTYRLKRKYTKHVSNEDTNRVETQQTNPTNIPMKRKYVRRSVNNQNINQSNTELKRKYTRRVSNDNNQQINRTNVGMQKMTQLSNVIKRKYTPHTRPSVAHSIPIAVINPVVPNVKQKFKCQFPRCGFVGLDAEQLKAHVQCIHKNNSNFMSSPLNQHLFKCYFPDCPFIGYNSQALREHIASQHNTDHQIMHKSGYKLFKCKHPNCFFAGSLTLKGLRIHVNRNHKRFGANNDAKSRHKPMNVMIAKSNVKNSYTGIQRPVIAVNRKPQFDEEFQRQNICNRNVMVFKCSFIDCSFSVQNLVDLRKHISSAHQNFD